MGADPAWIVGGDQASAFQGFTGGGGAADVLVGAHYRSNLELHEGTGYQVYGTPGGADLDSDGDGEPDSADCALFDPSARSLLVEVTSLRLLGNRVTLEWDPEALQPGSGTADDIERGMAGEWPGETCLEPAVPGPSAVDPAGPAEGSAYRYRVCAPGTRVASEASGRTAPGRHATPRSARSGPKGGSLSGGEFAPRT